MTLESTHVLKMASLGISAIALAAASAAHAAESAAESASYSADSDGGVSSDKDESKKAAQSGQIRGGDGEGLEIVVTGDRVNSFGADYVQAGTFRGAKQIDTPLTVSVIPETMLKAQQANGLMDALRNSPGVVASQIAPTVYSNLTIRGITVENRGNYRLNGSLPIINLINLPLENKLRVEALKGASSLYYGFTTPGGLINLTTKRATATPYASLTMSANNFGQAVAAIEASNTWGPLGVRLTAVGGPQKNGIDNVEGNRSFFAGAFDLKPTDRLTVSFDVEQIFQKITEPTQVQLVSTAPVIPALLDPSTNLGSKWLYSTSQETNLLLHVNYKALDWLTLTADAGQSRLTRDRHYSAFQFCTASLCGATGTYASLFPTGYTSTSGVVTVNQSNHLYYRNRMARTEAAFDFKAGIIKNSLVIGYSYNKRLQQVPSTANTAATNYIGTVYFAQDYLNPVTLPSVDMVPRVLRTFTSISDQGYYAFDRMEIGPWVQLLGGVRKADYSEYNEMTGARTFHTTPTTLSGSVIVKPVKWASIYGSYIEGLETTALAPSTAANAYAQLPASSSTQYEGGIKIEPIEHFLLTAAYFTIDRQSAAVNPLTNVYEFIGKARFKGVELSATGEVTPNLSLYLTGLFLDPKQVSSGTASLVGKVIENTAKRTWSAFAQYKLPWVKGLAVSAGSYFVGKRYVNATNLASVPSYTLFDLGASYTTMLSGKEVTFRVNGENITGKRYWAATGSSLLAQGTPTVVKFSLQTVF